VSGVLFKRAMNIKRVRYAPTEAAPEMPEPWQGRGETVVRWLFSESPGTAEGLLTGRGFRFLQDVELLPGASTGQRQHPGTEIVLYIVQGTGRLHHRPTPGSPIIVRPLRPGDAALVADAEFYSLLNPSEDVPLRLILLGLNRE
jgi:quercetin dioxygenase-like cupin family protein